MYISRQLSFKAASFNQMMVDLTPSQKRMYDDTVKFWAELYSCFAEALHTLKTNRTR